MGFRVRGGAQKEHANKLSFEKQQNYIIDQSGDYLENLTGPTWCLVGCKMVTEGLFDE